MAAPRIHWPTFGNAAAFDTARGAPPTEQLGPWCDGTRGVWELRYVPHGGTVVAEATATTRAGVMAVTLQRLPDWVKPPRWAHPLVLLAEGIAWDQLAELLAAHEPATEPGAVERLRDALADWQPWRAALEGQRTPTRLASRVAGIAQLRAPRPELPPAAEG